MIEDAGKKEKHTLPMIVEETLRSTESISTLGSDTLTLASLEADLFEDIRASIQKSSKTSNFQTFGSKAGQSSFGAHAHHCKSICCRMQDFNFRLLFTIPLCRLLLPHKYNHVS